MEKRKRREEYVVNHLNPEKQSVTKIDALDP